ncbi:two-component system response regulator [Ruegeria sp. Alg231-54]|uniref:response regulator n=1 Tax=Ruegeria sp. Alg231-54 TaxID=1922221 RepID=UPI001F2A35D6|nr:response regulator [Ruegeria sp. Alg231-54]
MSVQGTILVLDGTSTNRIMLKVKLTAAWYHVVQTEKLQGLAGLLSRTRPDLVLAAQTLPDGSAADVKRLVMANAELADVPVVAIAPQNDKAARLQALSDGLDDVLAAPFKDTLLLARIRSLLRARRYTRASVGRWIPSSRICRTLDCADYAAEIGPCGYTDPERPDRDIVENRIVREIASQPKHTCSFEHACIAVRASARRDPDRNRYDGRGPEYVGGPEVARGNSAYRIDRRLGR